MKTEKVQHNAYEKPAMRIIPMRGNVQILNVSNYDGAETD